MHDQQTIPLSRLKLHCVGAVSEGVAQDGLFADSMIELDHGDDRDRIGGAQYLLLWMNMARSIEDSTHGLGLGRVPLGHSSLTLRVMLGSATLGDALAAAQRFYGLTGNIARVRMTVAGDQVELAAHCNSRFDDTRATIMEDVGLGWLFMCCSYFLGRPLPVTHVTTRDREYFGIGQPHWAVKAPTSWGRVTSLRFPQSVLKARRRGATSTNSFWDCLRFWLAFIDDPDNDGLSPIVNATELNLSTLAREKGVSPSTLRRHLADQHGGFRRIRQHALIDATFALLKGSDASVDSIAAELGYSDARSLRRFTKSATGLTPQDLRLIDRLPDKPPAPNLAVHDRIREIAAELAGLEKV